MERNDNGRCTSESFMALERERLWPRLWLLAGLAADVAEPGRCFTFDLGSDSIVVVNDGGTLRAFHNVCQHRGHPLRPRGLGEVATFRCPYHGWTYGLDGSLRQVPDRDTFEGGVADSEFSLTPLGCEPGAGLVWVHMGVERPPLVDVPSLVACDLARSTLIEDMSIEVGCNWKVAAGQPPRAGGGDDEQIFPNVTVVTSASETRLYRYRPHPRDPQRTLIDRMSWRRPAPGNVAARPAHELWSRSDARLDPAFTSEVDRLEELQRVLESEIGSAPALSHAEQAMAAEMDRVMLAVIASRTRP
jgi:nitrite reductase/ring-hydroxylating ferredoxin subunit